MYKVYYIIHKCMLYTTKYVIHIHNACYSIFRLNFSFPVTFFELTPAFKYYCVGKI